MGGPGAIATASLAAIVATEAGAGDTGTPGPNFDENLSDAIEQSIELIASALTRAAT